MRRHGPGILFLSGCLGLLPGYVPTASAEAAPAVSCAELLEGLARPHPLQTRLHLSSLEALAAWRQSSRPAAQKNLFIKAQRRFSEAAKHSARRAFELERKNLHRWYTRRKPYQVPEKFLQARANRLVRAASAHLEAQNVPHTLSLGPNGPYLDIEPGSQSPLNEFAQELARAIPAARVQYHPHVSLNDSAAFFMASSDPNDDWALLTLSNDSILEASPFEPYVEHEAVHADNHAKLRKGILSPYQIAAEAAPGTVLPRSRLYADYLQMDELEAYQVNVEAGAERWIEAIERPDSHPGFNASVFLRQLKSFSEIAQSAEAIAALSLAAVNRLAQADPPSRAKFEREGVPYEATLEWSQDKWKNRQAMLHITSADVDFKLRIPLAPPADSAALHRTLTLLQQGAQASRERWDALSVELSRYLAERGQPAGPALREKSLRLAKRWALPGL